MQLFRLWPFVIALASLVTAVYVAIIQWRNKVANLRPARQLIDRARFVAGLPIAKVQEASVVRMVGTVEAADRALVGPIAGGPCVWWGVRVAVRRTMGVGWRETKYWQDLLDLSDGAPFALADGSAECLVDPALATVSMAQTTTRVIERGRPMPSNIAVFLTANGLSLDELRDESFRIEEMLVVPGTRVVVVGAGRLVQRSAVQGEADYRASQASWMSFDAQELELLVTDHKRLVAHAPAADRTPLDPREIWEPRVAADRSASISVDEYEAVMRARKRFARIAVIGGLALIVGSAVGIPKLLAWQRESEPTTLWESELASLRDLTQHQRVAMYRSDDAWIRAMGNRWNVTAREAPCPQVASDTPVATIPTQGSLPPQSPRTDRMLRQLDVLDAAFPIATAGTYFSLYHQTTATAVGPRDVLIERGSGSRAQAWLYDHDQSRIICTGTVDPAAPFVGLQSVSD